MTTAAASAFAAANSRHEFCKIMEAPMANAAKDQYVTVTEIVSVYEPGVTYCAAGIWP